MPWRWLTACALLALFLTAGCTPGEASSSVEEDDWDTVESRQKPEPAVEVIHPANGGALQPGNSSATQPPQQAQKFDPLKYKWEMLALVFCAAYCVNIYVGKQRNARIALGWADAFTGPGCLMDRNFSLLGPGDATSKQLLVRESASEFLFYASGRRHCMALHAVLALRKRQDLLQGYLLEVVMPSSDRLDLEFRMNVVSMPPMVLAIAQPRIAREMLKGEGNFRDVKAFAHRIDVTRDKVPSWPGKELVVLAEHSQLFYDLMSDRLLELVFGQAAFQQQKDFFRYLHFTSEGTGAHKQVLRFSLVLPPPDRMGALEAWLTAALVCVDLVGSYRLGPEARRRADKQRESVDVQRWQESEDARREAATERRASKAKAEAERVKRMTPEARQKHEERVAKLEQKRAMRRRMVRA